MKSRRTQRVTRNRFFGAADQRTGAAMVEFAIVANILFVSILACFEIARMNMVRNMAQDAAYFAARQAIVPGATVEEATLQATQLMDSMVSPDGYTVNVTPLDGDTEEIVVTVTVDLDAVALFTPIFLPNAQIETEAHMNTERYDGFYEQ